MSIKDQIKEAETKQEKIKIANAAVRSHRFASAKTIRKWERAVNS